MYVFLVDFGSTFVKYLIYDTERKCELRSDKVPFPEPNVQSGGRFTVSEAEIRKLVEQVFSIGVQYKCQRSYISVQMHGHLLRGADGMMSDYISWRDSSGDTDDRLLREIGFDRRGTSLKKNLPYVKLWKDREVLSGAELYTLGSYITFLLTGKNITHVTDGCASGFYDAETLEGDGLGGLKLPILKDEISAVGDFRGMELYTPMGDHQISYLGSGAGESAYLVNIGTATQVSCLAGRGYPTGAYEMRPYFRKGLRLLTMSGLTGGDRLFQGDGKSELLDEIMDAVRMLPEKSEVVFGGGGSRQVYTYMHEELERRGISSRLLETNIGMEGLKMIADDKKIEAGTMLSEIGFTNFPIILKNTGMDFFIIDCEHGAFDFTVLSSLIVKAKLAGIRAIIRLGDNRRELITKFADAGATGFLLPMTNCVGDIKEVVKYAKYSPVGKRGISTTRAHTLYNPPELKTYMKTANETMRIYAQIETAEGVKNISSILATEGVDGVFVGPNDLSDDLDCIGNTEPVKACIQTVSEAAQRVQKKWGIITAKKELIDFSVSCGVSMVSYGSELNMLIDGCKNIKKRISDYENHESR